MKHVLQIDPGTEQPRKLASFALEGGALNAIWHDPAFRYEAEQIGIRGARGRVTPTDGPGFYAALDQAFIRSSFRYVADDATTAPAASTATG